MDVGLAGADGLAIEVERIPHQPLAGRDRHRRGVLRDVVGQFQRGRQNIGGVEHPAAQPQLHRPMPIESCSGQEDFGRVGDPDQSRQHPVRVGITDDAPPDLHNAVTRVGGEEPDVALQGQRQAQAHGVSVDGGDYRLGQRPCGHVDPGRRKSRPRFGEGPLTAAEVGAGAERGRGTGQHDHPHRVVAVANPVGVGQLVAHPVADRVALLWPVERNGGHAAVDGEQQGAINGHRPTPYRRRGERWRGVGNLAGQGVSAGRDL
jgi:hypothetical protein